MHRAAIVTAIITCAAASAEVDGLRVYVQVAAPEQLADPAALLAAGADGVVLPAEALRTEDARQRVAAIHAAGLQCWGALELRDDFDAGDLVTADWVAGVGADALLLTSLPPIPDDTWPARQAEGPPSLLGAFIEHYGFDPRDAAEDSFERLLFVRLAGQRTTSQLAALAEAIDLRIILALRPGDERPETARGRYLDLHALVARGLIDGVLFATEAPVELRRPRLATDRAILAGLLAPGAAASATLAALRSPGADTLVVPAAEGDSAADAAARVARAAESFRAQQARRGAVAEAIERGELVVIAGAEPEGDLDLATIHGVAQSFTLDAPARISAVGLFCSLRGSGALGLADQVVQLCADAGDAPDTAQVLAEGAVPASAFADGGWSWGYASFDPPVELPAGMWWLHCPNTQSAGNSYLWRISKDSDLCASGQAWSRSYAYEGYDWIFRVLTPAEGAGP